MSPDEYCREKATPRGSSLHYSLLRLPTGIRQGVIALHALGHELLDQIPETGDTQPTAVRLAWWTAEIDRLLSGEPRHPVTRALAPQLGLLARPAKLFHNLLEAARGELENQAWADFDTLRRHQLLGLGSLARLQASLCGARHDDSASLLVGSALFADLVTRLRDVGRYARKGIVSIPLQDLEVGGVSPSDLLERIPNQAMRDLLTRQAARATSLYRDNLVTVDTRIDTNARLPAVALARLRLRLLEEIRASGFQILDRRMELTPLRKFWIAARTR